MTELVSVLMPAKNAAAFIAKSIRSILSQSYQNLELIIINDKSTDNTLEVIQSINDPRIRVIDGPGTGISNAFNTGLTAARGQFLCRCDADDLYPPTRLDNQVSWLTDNPKYIAVCGMYSSIDIKDRHLIQYNRETYSMDLDHKFANGVVRTHFCTFLTRINVLREIGGCRPFFVTAEDIDLQFRLSEKGSIYFLATNAYLYRLHNLSITHNQSNNAREFYENIARKCHEQRRNFGVDDIQKGIVPTEPEGYSSPKSTETHILDQLISESWYWHDRKEKFKSFNAAIKVIKIYPFAIKAWRNIFIVGLKLLN